MLARPLVLLLLALGAVAALTVLGIAVVALDHQVGRIDAAADAHWWAGYAEHVSLLGVAALLASSGRPGWRILAGLTGAAQTYLGLVAAFVLPDHTASWGGLAGMCLGLVLLRAAAVPSDVEWSGLAGGIRPHRG